LAGKEKELAGLEAKTQEPGFWDNQANAQEHLKKIKKLRLQVEPWQRTGKDCDDLAELAELLQQEADPQTEAEVEAGAQALEKRLDDLEFRVMMSGETDPNNCFLHIHAGAGGTESCDWAAMLIRMYQRWCERRGYQMEEVEFMPGDEAGVKSATFLVKGEFAYGYLKAETGVHRLVRISPFDANKRRHTSFASVFATPEIDDTIDLDLREEDLKIDTYRSTGAGGQHVNTTDSAVRITHLPSKIVVACQNERSQHKNKATAFKVLRARLYQFELEKKRVEQAAREGERKDISWGSQIRSYVFQPYQMVKDLRSGWETGNIQAVMDGQIDELIHSCLKDMSRLKNP
jgi:peptide chain release factor 2